MSGPANPRRSLFFTVSPLSCSPTFFLLFLDSFLEPTLFFLEFAECYMLICKPSVSVIQSARRRPKCCLFNILVEIIFLAKASPPGLPGIEKVVAFCTADYQRLLGTQSNPCKHGNTDFKPMMMMN